MVVDVRPRDDCASQQLGKVLSLPLAQLSGLAPGQLDPAQAVVTVCDSTYCASLAVGVLERLGFKQAGCLEGGPEAWAAAGLPVSGAESPVAKKEAAPAPRRVPQRVVRLPQRISASDLKRALLDLPGTFELIDIRPPEAFAAYSLPGSVNVDVADILQSTLYLKGSGPLILVDRDGSLAMAVGGALSQKTWRPIKVLYGGLDAYKKEMEVKPQEKKKPAPVSPEKANTPAPEAKAGAPWWKRLFQ